MRDPEKAEYYRERAAVLREEAERASKPEQRRILLGIVAMYQRLAKQFEDGDNTG